MFETGFDQSGNMVLHAPEEGKKLKNILSLRLSHLPISLSLALGQERVYGKMTWNRGSNSFKGWARRTTKHKKPVPWTTKKTTAGETQRVRQPLWRCCFVENGQMWFGVGILLQAFHRCFLTHWLPPAVQVFQHLQPLGSCISKLWSLLLQSSLTLQGRLTCPVMIFVTFPISVLSELLPFGTDFKLGSCPQSLNRASFIKEKSATKQAGVSGNSKGTAF